MVSFAAKVSKGWIESRWATGPMTQWQLCVRSAPHPRLYTLNGRPLSSPIELSRTPESRLSAMESWTPHQVRSLHVSEDAYLARVRQDDLIDNYVRPFTASHPEDFPQSVDDL
jgi:hypothetical protein